MQTTEIHNIIALDVGDKRVGVAMTNTLARLPGPFTTLVRDESFWQKLELLIRENDVTQVVVGLPRNLRGENTAQTERTKQFISEMKIRLEIEAEVQDEALTSRQAEEELRARGKQFAKGDVDSLAAAYILEDYLNARSN